MSIKETPQLIPKDSVPSKGKDFTVVEARNVKDIETSMGVVHKGFSISGRLEGDDEEYGALFGLDKKEITGSAGRILSKLKINHIDQLTDKKIKELEGMKLRVTNKGGKLYWS